MKTFGNLEIEVSSPIEGFAVVQWRGESDAMEPGKALSPYLKEVAQSLRGKNVEVRFGDLRYMNSSTVTPLMQFLKELAEAAGAVTVLYRQDLQWQVTSFRAMRVAARKWNNVRVVGG
jgi:hypothetical protein